jgi:hypothetical protein
MTDLRERLGDFLVELTHDDEQILLVRPDGHLGWRGGCEETPALIHWVTELLAHGTTRRAGAPRRQG